MMITNWCLDELNLLIFFFLYVLKNTKKQIEEEDIAKENRDVDGDGYLQNEDCDDGNSTIFQMQWNLRWGR